MATSPAGAGNALSLRLQPHTHFALQSLFGKVGYLDIWEQVARTWPWFITNRGPKKPGLLQIHVAWISILCLRKLFLMWKMPKSLFLKQNNVYLCSICGVGNRVSVSDWWPFMRMQHSTGSPTILALLSILVMFLATTLSVVPVLCCGVYWKTCVSLLTSRTGWKTMCRGKHQAWYDS